MIKKLLSLSIIAAFSAPVVAEEFCGQIISNNYHQNGKQLIALVLLSDLKDAKTKKPIVGIQGVKIVHPDTAFKVAGVISQLTVQDSEQMKKDLKNSEFNWYYMYGDELHPNPPSEDFQLCVEADLSSAVDGRLKSVTEITDILEDGYSVKDFL